MSTHSSDGSVDPRPQPNLHALFFHNEDGSISLMPSEEFLDNTHKQWDSSLIGHFIGGSFDFKFVRDQVFIIWKAKGLSLVYNSSKGYFTFRFGTID